MSRTGEVSVALTLSASLQVCGIPSVRPLPRAGAHRQPVGACVRSQFGSGILGTSLESLSTCKTFSLSIRALNRFLPTPFRGSPPSAGITAAPLVQLAPASLRVEKPVLCLVGNRVLTAFHRGPAAPGGCASSCSGVVTCGGPGCTPPFSCRESTGRTPPLPQG